MAAWHWIIWLKHCTQSKNPNEKVVPLVKQLLLKDAAIILTNETVPGDLFHLSFSLKVHLLLSRGVSADFPVNVHLVLFWRCHSWCLHSFLFLNILLMFSGDATADVWIFISLNVFLLLCRGVSADFGLLPVNVHLLLSGYFIADVFTPLSLS